MPITEVPATRIVDEDRSIVLVEVSDMTHDFFGRERGVETSEGWEFQCAACGDMSTGLSEREAHDELQHHECPGVPDADVPPCARFG